MTYSTCSMFECFVISGRVEKVFKLGLLEAASCRKTFHTFVLYKTIERKLDILDIAAGLWAFLCSNRRSSFVIEAPDLQLLDGLRLREI